MSSAECPRSVQYGWVEEMVTDWVSARAFEGALLYGPNLADWPCKIYDAFEIMNVEQRRAESIEMGD